MYSAELLNLAMSKWAATYLQNRFESN